MVHRKFGPQDVQLLDIYYKQFQYSYKLWGFVYFLNVGFNNFLDYFRQVSHIDYK